jgi:hypothetical protein
MQSLSLSGRTSSSHQMTCSKSPIKPSLLVQPAPSVMPATKLATEQFDGATALLCLFCDTRHGLTEDCKGLNGNIGWRDDVWLFPRHD